MPSLAILESNGNKSRNPSGSQEADKTQGKPGGNLEKLSKEELILKCRNLLAIAQKAKAAKDEVTAEAKKLKTLVKDADSVSAEAEALREMVADLTEGKVAYTTKVESLQRQLKIASSEVESLQEIENNLIRERNQLIAENSRLADEKQSYQEKLVSFKDSSSEKFKLLESSWQKEKLALEETVENLEAQNGQVDILKTKCKKLLEEKTTIEEELQKYQKIVAKSIKLEGEVKLLKEEKKADAIILESSKSEKKKLEEKLKVLESQVASLQKEREGEKHKEVDQIKIKELEDEVCKHKSQISSSETVLKEAQEKVHTLQKEIDCLKEKLEVASQSSESTNHELSLLKDELQTMAESNKCLQGEVEHVKLENEDIHQKYSLQIDEMKAELLKASTESTLKDTKEQELLEGKMQSDEKLKQLKVENTKLEEQIGILQRQLNEKSEQNANFDEKLKEKCNEVNEINEKLKKMENERVHLVDRNKSFSEKIEELEKLQDELYSISEEKSELIKRCENLESDVRLQREHLKNVEKQEECLKDVISKYENEANVKLKDDEKQKETVELLTSEIKDLKSLNDKLSESVKQLENDVKNSESTLTDIESSGNSLMMVCRKLYPLSQSRLSTESDVGQVMKGILELLNSVASKQLESGYEERFDNVLESLDKFQRHFKGKLSLYSESDWDVHAECFEKLSNSLINFSNSVTVALESSTERSSQFESIFLELALVYRKFCDNLKQECFQLSRLRKELDIINEEKLVFEKKLMDSSNDKCVLEKKLDETERKLSTSDKRCAEFENQIASGDSEKTEVVKSLQEQLFALRQENEKLSEAFKEISAAKDNLENSLEKQTLQLNKICAEHDSVLQAKKTVETEKESFENMLETLKSQSATKEKSLLDEKQNLEKKLTILSEEKITLEREFASLNVDKKKMEDNNSKEKQAISEKATDLLKEKDTWEREAKKLEQENQKLREDSAQLQKKIDDLGNDVCQMKDKIKSVEENHKTLKNEKDNFEKSFKEAENQNIQLNSSLEASSGRCEELLSELNEMNKVLRERGERISRLEASNKEKTEQLEATKNQLVELQNKMSSSEAELASKQEQLQTITEKLQSYSSESSPPSSSPDTQEITNLEEKVKELEQEKASLNKTIQALESELQSLRENAAPGHDAQSEIMSTSTISRAEDSQRMKELEDTFEERYMKLKSVAIRLKKRVAELTAQLNSAEESRNKLVSEKEDLKKKVDGGAKESIKMTSKNIQIMQGEIDRLQDEVDSKKKELKEWGKQLTSAAEQLAAVKSQLAESQEENATLLKTLKNQEESIASSREESANLRGQIAALEKRLSAETEQQLAIEERRKKAEEQMEEQRNKAAQYAKELEEAKQDIKNKSLMDLEMRDYELTVEDLNKKLSEKETIIVELQAEISREKGRSNSLQDQLTHLTAQEATERERAEKMKKLLLDHKTQLAELRQSQEVHLASQESDRATIEELTQEVEKQKLVLSEVSKEKTNLEDTVRKIKLSSERQIELLEEQLSKYKADASQLKTELDAVKKDFEGYKVRATSVLRQKARAPEVDVNELKGEKAQLQENYEAAQLRIQQLQSELSALRAEHSFLQSEKEGISRQVSSLTEDLAKRESLYREKLSSVESKLEAKVAEYQLIVSNMSSQNETLSNSFKKQLETMKQTHVQEIEQLTNKLEETEDKLWQLKNTVSTSVTPTNGSASTPGLVMAHPIRTEGDHGNTLHSQSTQHRRQLSSHGCEEPRIDVSNMVREEGEGSEWVEPVHRSPSRPGGYSPPPLEQLINSPLPSNVGIPPQEDTISIASINTEATAKEIARLEAKLSSGEMRIHQLTALLHESEAENAKLVQLSDALKEEIRRSSRNESREKHMENMEYMKNIILKFLVMKHGEERKHMVPVLKTVLQLSPQETADLEHFAVGGDEGGSAQGWGSYLHLWSTR
ncbi:GRIP and coiled-coil domain-containing protein 2-like isoform X4 [Macrobrachium rosenbergii]|uniref:GRIP and coiled-coil domain-containing protein 2-like isoform X4 n=1 Tax=Macrobrachium rosenbergii TaxID=79674 RepID=UPI0034D73769